VKNLALLLALPLSACAIVSVQADGGRPSVGVYPLGVRVSRGDAQAVSVSVRTIGLWSGCYATQLGLSSTDCDVIDAKACSAALVHTKSPNPKFIDRLAGATRAVCPNPGEP